MKDFKDLFTSEGLLEKMAGVWVNKEGIFNYSPDDGPEMLRHFADLTSRLGLEIAGLKLPLIGSRRENAITLKIDASASGGPRAEISGGGLLISAPDLAGLDRMIKAFVLDQDEAGSSAGEYDTHANVAPRLDLNEDFRVLWSDDWALDPEAALEFFARTAMDSFTACFPYTADAEEEGRRYLKIDAGDGSGACAGDCAGCADRIEFCENGDITVHRYSPEGAARLAAGYAASLQTLKDIKGDYWLSDLEDVLAGRNDLGQMAAAGACCTDEPCRLVTRENSRAIVDREKWSELTGIKLARHNDPKPIRSWEYEEEWEGETFLKAFREKLAGARPGSVVDVEGILSEDLDVRQDLERELRALIEGAGAVPGEVRVYRSFKSGISWIEEKVIPELAALDRKPDRIDIEFRYFMNEKGDDAFEDESVPNYGVNLDKPDKWFDIPTRWLQELHPVDELIEAKLGLPKEAVNFLRSDDQSRTYRLTAYSGDDVVWAGDFTTAFVKKHYMNRYPLIGWTHVSTGHLLVKENGSVTLDLRIATDMEKLWGHLEDEVLPDLEEYLVAKYGKAELPAMQPLFGRLDIDVRMSEMDFDIGVRNERISMLESMQEDIYFYILDWFKTYGERECGKALDNVGLIFPKPENGKRQPAVMKIVLSDELSDSAKLICGGSEEPVEELENSVRIAGLSFGEDGTPCVCLNAIPADAGSAAALENRLKTLAGYVEKGIAVYPAGKPIKICAEVAGGGCAAALIPAYRRKAPDLTEEERLDILKHRVVDYPTYMRLLDYYAAKPEFRVLPVGTTYKGRKLYAVEAVKKPEGVCWSRYKLQTARITALFNARHHGNESTSLNSGFLLLDRILEDPELGALTDRLNIISVPW
ncbi:MAG: hypothetical protein IKE37_08510, partial [Firmicutes bacterium]|nr:hypothetical protein [Bacillota bacterium]